MPAYSTLGRLNWLGGDPLLNTFIRYPEGELARLIFHELAHQVAYASDDTSSTSRSRRRSSASAAQRWLQTQADDAAREEYERYDAGGATSAS